MRIGSELPTTSQPSIGDFLACYEPLLQAGHDIVSIHLSAGISGTYDSALQARAQLVERGLDEGRIEVLDSRTVCGGLGLAAARRRRAGARRRRACRRSPRTPRAAREQPADLVRARHAGVPAPRRARRRRAGLDRRRAEDQADPLAGVEITPVERVRTAGRAFERMVEYMRTLHADGADALVRAAHPGARRRRSGSSSAGREIFGCEPLFVGEVGPVIGAHAGPGLIGVGGLPGAAAGAVRRARARLRLRFGAGAAAAAGRRRFGSAAASGRRVAGGPGRLQRSR